MSKPKIVVIGAGSVGLFAGLRLAERGADVTLIDGDAGLSENASASLAAAGMLSPLGEAENEPENAHPRATELALASFDLWRASPAPLRAYARFDGGLILGDAPHATAQARTHERKADTLTPAEIEARFGLKIAGERGVYVEDEGVIEPAPMLAALATALKEAGGALHFDVEAEIVDGAPWKRVRCSGGESFTADHVVVAPGAWARDKLQESAPALKHIRPAKGCLAIASVVASVRANVRGEGFYLAPRGEGQAVLGSTMQFDVFDRRAEPEKIDALFAAAERALPGQVTRTHAPNWAGVRPMSPDWSPMIGPSGEAIVAAGHSRNGWLLAPMTAEIVCAYVFGEDLPPLWAAFSPDRFAT